jgi:hypothetical protein
MLGFDVARFRELAFGHPVLPGHPLRDESAVEEMLAELSVDPLTGLAELTHWVQSVDADDSYTPELRSRLLLALETAARPYWGELAMQYLAPDGSPAEGRDGDPAILRAMLDSATAVATGYGFGLETDGHASRWSEKNLATVALRRAQWIARRFTLVNMLHLPLVDDLWEDLHQLHALAGERQVWRKTVLVHPDSSRTSSVKQEYARLVLIDLAGLEALSGRDVELAFRIAGRVAVNARLEAEPIPGAICAIEPHGASRPVAVRRLHGTAKTVLYLDAFNCLPRLKAMLERNMDVDPSEPDTLFGTGYTVRERNAMVNRLIDLWGPTPPQRRSKRVPFNAVALVNGGFANSVGVIRPLEQGGWGGSGGGAAKIRMVLDDAGKAKKPQALRKSLAATQVQLVDASVGGLGLVVPRKEASWARLGALIAVYVEPGPDWVVGALRRISGENGQLRLGVAVFTRQPKLAWFHVEATGYASVWEEEKRLDRDFLENFQRGVLIDADSLPLGPGEMLIAPGIASRGSRFDLPFAQGVQRIRVTAVRETTEDFDRVAFESLGVTPHGAIGK